MSAQDDVLAAFGEPRAVSAAKAGDAAEVGEQTAAEESGQDAVEADEQAAAEVSGQDAADVNEQAAAEISDQVAGEAGEQGQAEVSEQVATEPTSDAEPGHDSVAEQVGGIEAGEQTPEEPAGDPEPQPAPEPPAPPVAQPQPYLDPAAFFAQLQAEAAPKPQRRWPRLVLRYASALVVAGAVGAGTAYAITLPRRTDVLFLATPGDGRYAFLGLVKPAPPVGKPAPGDEGNDGQVHYNDLRQYLLPAPIGGVVKEDGWESAADFESSVTGSDVSNHLDDEGLRHVARRGWVAPDGQHTVIELLQFPDHESAFAVESLLDSATPAKAGHAVTVVPTVATAGFGDNTETVAMRKFDQVDGLPGQTERRVVFQTGDVVAIITTTAPAKVPDTPTEQVVLLEAQMLR